MSFFNQFKKNCKKCKRIHKTYHIEMPEKLKKIFKKLYLLVKQDILIEYDADKKEFLSKEHILEH